MIGLILTDTFSVDQRIVEILESGDENHFPQLEHPGKGRKIFKSNFHLRGHSQTTFTAMGGGEVHEMSMLLNKFGKFH